MEKPLKQKAYGSIPHLPGSRLGKGDHHCHEGQAKIALEKVRDKHDIIIVQEKLDGSNCCVAKVNGEILALGRSGYLAESSLYPIHHVFHKWVQEHKNRFNELLNERERVCGEFLAQAVGTRYKLTHEPFVPFDILLVNDRTPYEIFKERTTKLDFTLPRLIHNAPNSLPIEKAIEAIKVSGHGAIDEVEGVIYRIERRGKVDFLTKFVHHHKQDGKYFPENTGGNIIWNIDVSKYIANP